MSERIPYGTHAWRMLHEADYRAIVEHTARQVSAAIMEGRAAVETETTISGIERVKVNCDLSVRRLQQQDEAGPFSIPRVDMMRCAPVFIEPLDKLGLDRFIAKAIASKQDAIAQLTKKEKPVKKEKMKRFYVGKPGVISSDHAKATMKEAIEHAKQLCVATGQEQTVVQVIRIVRKRPNPIDVEVVRG